MPARIFIKYALVKPGMNKTRRSNYNFTYVGDFGVLRTLTTCCSFVPQAGGGLEDFSSKAEETKRRTTAMRAGSGIFGGGHH